MSSDSDDCQCEMTVCLLLTPSSTPNTPSVKEFLGSHRLRCCFFVHTALRGPEKNFLSGYGPISRWPTTGKLLLDLVLDHLFHIPSTGCRSEKYFRWGDRRHFGFWGSRISGTLGVGAVPSHRNLFLQCPSMAFKPPGRHYFRFRLNRGQKFPAKIFSRLYRTEN